jgi:3',5'-cyclic AMP phosphodiesterase CpdA
LVVTVGADHPDTLRCLGDVAVVTRRTGGTGPEADAGAAVDRLADVIGHEHPSVQTLRGGRLVARVIDPNPF